MTDTIAEITRFAEKAAPVVGHRFEIVTALGDGTSIPPEALSEDHTIGVYGEVIPRKMRESMAGFVEIGVADLLPQTTLIPSPSGARVEWFLEYPGLRGVRFRAEKLQYLEEGWWAVTSEVKYPAATVLGLMHVMKTLHGAAHICLNTEMPLPLWLRPGPLGADVAGAQAVVQARGEGLVLFTNIHSECTMEFARQFAEAARGYYRVEE